MQEFIVVDVESVPILGIKGCTDLNLIKRVDSINDYEKGKFINKNHEAWMFFRKFEN